MVISDKLQCFIKQIKDLTYFFTSVTTNPRHWDNVPQAGVSCHTKNFALKVLLTYKYKLASGNQLHNQKQLTLFQSITP